MVNFWKGPRGESGLKGLFHLRIDERLIHGQVVLGWGLPLEINCLILANNRVSESAGERELYLQIIPEELGGSVLRVDQAVAQTPEIRRRGARCLVVVLAVADALKWIESGNAPDLLVLGGVHPKPGRRFILDYVSLSDEEIEQLKSAVQHHVKVVCQDVWSGRPVDFEAALSRAGINY